MSDHEDHSAPETSTVSGAHTMPSPNAFEDMFKAVMAPVLSQLTNLNENVSSMLLNGHYDSDEDGETASKEEPAKSSDMDAGKDANNEAMPAEVLLKELAQVLTVNEETSPPLRKALAAIFNNLLSEKMGDEKLKAKLDKYPRPENVKSLQNPKVNPSIWSQVLTAMKAQDVRSQKGHNTLIGTIAVMTKAADLAFGKYSQDKELINTTTRGISSNAWP